MRKMPPAAPMLSMLPVLPMLRMLPLLPMLKMLPALPILNRLPALARLSTLAKLYRLTTLRKLPRLLTLAREFVDCRTPCATLSLTDTVAIPLPILSSCAKQHDMMHAKEYIAMPQCLLDADQRETNDEYERARRC